MLYVYLLLGLIIGGIFGFASGKTYQMLYLDDETNEKVEALRKQRIDMEEIKLQIARTQTLVELHKLAARLNQIMKKGETK